MITPMETAFVIINLEYEFSSRLEDQKMSQLDPKELTLLSFYTIQYKSNASKSMFQSLNSSQLIVSSQSAALPCKSGNA